jgi:hypothetical protein
VRHRIQQELDDLVQHRRVDRVLHERAVTLAHDQAPREAPRGVESVGQLLEKPAAISPDVRCRLRSSCDSPSGRIGERTVREIGWHAEEHVRHSSTY